MVELPGVTDHAVKHAAKIKLDKSPEFRYIKIPECGPCCRARDNGSGRHVIVVHCDRCHAEKDLPIEERPGH
jgi:hypothetical protein